MLRKSASGWPEIPDSTETHINPPLADRTPVGDIPYLTL